MKREVKYQRRHIKSFKVLLLVVVLGFFTTILLSFCILNKHLYKIQNIERLARFQDYDMFSLKFPKQICNLDKPKLIYEENNNRYYSNCLEDILVYYGSTSTTLTMALQKEYMTYNLLIKNTKQKSYDNYKEYTHNATENNGYKVKVYPILDENDFVHQDIYIEPLN